ncbi:protein mono-ADP-ribosyltransferase PARP14-like isoform X2 [Notolabrus celidotus]|uniref:protein mono-ADP-ribosyltransferase PARP14-like isoform X2 n=1 Tax=Notolabrus celidotus TaxID=1203425 RepID=UPI00148FABEA|nr:protein mono-ADP-ribosyltransferase PARP14-like isoform X2 [Notolabrus celidotus]
MGDTVECPPVTVEGDWTQAPSKTVKNKLQLYFNSRKKSSGGDCRVELEDGAPRADVYFRSEEVRERVLARQRHEILLHKPVKLRLSSAPCPTNGDDVSDSKPRESEVEAEDGASAEKKNESVQILSVVLDNVGDNIQRDLLQMLVENISGVEEGSYSLEMILESNRAVVTFNSPADLEKFLSVSQTSQKLQKYKVSARQLEAANSVRVESLSSRVVDDMLEMYFGKHWVQPESIIMIPEEEAAIVTFTDPKVVESICVKRDYSIGSTPVRVYPYYESLSTALYGKERPTWKMPEPLTESVQSVIWKFLQKKKLFDSINDQMRPYHCSVNMDKPEAKLSPVPNYLRQKGLTAQQVDTWQSTALDAFRRLMSQYTAFECPANKPAWKAAEDEVLSVVREDAVLVLDASKEVLTVAGQADNMKKIRSPVEDIVLRAMRQNERQTKGVSEAVVLSPAMHYILKQEGLQKAAQDTSPDMDLSYDTSTQRLSIKGLSAEVYQMKSWILEKNMSMSKKQIEVPPSLLQFLKTVDPMGMSQHLFTSQGISAIFNVDSKGVSLVGSSDPALTSAESKMKEVLSFQTLDVEDQEVLKHNKWANLNKELLDSYNSSKGKIVSIQICPGTRDKITVAGFKNPVKEISRSLVEFISDHSRIQESVRVKSCAVVQFIDKRKSEEWSSIAKDNSVNVNLDSRRKRIVIAGARLHVQKAKSCFKELTDSLFSDNFSVNKPGAKKYFQSQGGLYLTNLMSELSCVVMLRPENDEEEEEEEVEVTYEEGGGESYCKVKTAGGVLVSVRKANICSFGVDAVVNAANEDLQHIGGLALALLKAAGPELQKISNDHVSQCGKLRPGDAIVTGACNLPCKYVVHAVGPRFSDSDKKTAVSRLKLAVRQSLKEAEKVECSSIALPAISSGVFGFPVDLCTETIAQAVREYCDDPGRLGSLTEIHLVDNNDNTVRVLASAVNREFSDLEPTMTIPPPAGGGRGGRPQASGGYQQGRGRGGHQGPSSRGHHFSERGGGHHGGGRRAGEAGDGFQQVPQGNRGHGEHGGHRGRGGRRGRGGHEGPGAHGGHGAHGGPGRMEQTTAEGLKIALWKGNIQDQTTHVIVNTIDENMNLKQGAVSKAILQAAGPSLQKAVLSQAGVSTLLWGDVIITDGFNLMCQKVFHVVCPFWDNGGGQAEETLVTIIRHCLMEAENLKMASLSFPAIGTGNLSFPRDVVSRVLLREIHAFSSRKSPTHLREVAIVVHPGDSQTVDRFTREFRGNTEQRNFQQDAWEMIESAAVQIPSQSQQTSASFGQVSSPSLGVYQMQMGSISLEVSSGDITKETCDVIINSSNQAFNLRTGVSKAILDSAGVGVQLECTQIVNSPGYQPRPLIMTSAGQLPSRNIIHVIGQNDPTKIKDIVYSVLKLCEEQKFMSVAFPALGTGQGGANPSLVADAMVDAVVDFVRKKHPKSVGSVKILIFQTSMVTEFHKSMKRREGEGVEEKSVFTKFKNAVTSFLFTGGSEERSNRGNLVLETQEFGLTEFQICADNKKALSEAKKRIEELIVAEQAQKTIKDSYINKLSQEDMDELKELQRTLTVSIRLDKGQEDEEPKIHLEGLTRDVFAADSSIRDIIRKVERNEVLKGRALLVSSLVEWQFQHPNGQMVPFDIVTNLKLEEALEKKENVKIKIHNQTYNTDLKFMRAVSSTGGKMMELLRKDLKVDASLPSHWEDMKGDLLKLFPLKAGSSEYTDVETELTRTGLLANIISIERVQHLAQWQGYQIKKDQLEKKNNHKNNEKRLFHGTGADSIDLINTHGFNRSHAGKHAAMFGNGTYFAVDPSYSAQGYATPDTNGHKRMYLAKVLVGDHTKGSRGLLTPPSKNSGNASDLYDSVTDNTNPPTMFIVFNDSHAYPEYLITFT